MKLFRKNQKAMTLVEIIIWIGIFSILAGIMVANFRQGSQNESVRLASSLALSTLRKAQTMTLTGATLPDGTYPIGGYGVHFDSSLGNILILFADINGNKIYNSGVDIAVESIKISLDDFPKEKTIFNTLKIVYNPFDFINFGNLLKIFAPTPVFSAAAMPVPPVEGKAYFELFDNLDVVFTPPDGHVFLNGVASSGVYTIFFKSTSSNIIKKVVIYGISGQIREE
jgi:Tfp pilus assembly protein FimT